MAAPRRAGRQKPQLPTCYYEGNLEKRSFKDKTGRKLWTSLCGNSLFFFNNSKDTDYMEKLDLSEFVSLNDDSSPDRKLEAARFQLHLKSGDFHLTAPSLEARELWKGFILSVVELTVPSSLNLLPGQIHMLREVVEKEISRRKPLPALPSTNIPAQQVYITPLCDMPACYQLVSRAEAELILERNQEKGNLLLRPGRDGTSFAVSTRQEITGSVYKHYRVTRSHEGGFTIAVDNPIHCKTLQDVIDYLVMTTGGSMKPLIMEGAYEKNITFVDSNKENGEAIIVSTNSSPEPSVSLSALKPPKPGQRESVPSTQLENLYLEPSEIAEDQVDENVVTPPPVQPRVPVRPLPKLNCIPDGLTLSPGGALLPPCHQSPRARRNSMSGPPRAQTQGPSFDTDTLSKSLSEELKLKLRKRQATADQSTAEFV